MKHMSEGDGVKVPSSAYKVITEQGNDLHLILHAALELHSPPTLYVFKHGGDVVAKQNL